MAGLQDYVTISLDMIGQRILCVIDGDTSLLSIVIQLGDIDLM